MREETAVGGEPTSTARRRVGRVLIGCLAALALTVAVGAVMWWGWWPRHRPALAEGQRYGIDVSSHQGAIDWPAVAGDDIAAVYLKATEGATWKDPRFETNWRGAKAAGLAVGGYHFFTLCRTGTEQADNFLASLSSVGWSRADLAPVVDLEFGGNCAARPPREALVRELSTFVERVETSTGRQMMLYVLADFEEAYPLPDQLTRPRWVRRLILAPDPGWSWWQVNQRATVNGINRPVDVNVIARDALPVR